jgi:hypothetical protein
MAGPPSLCYGKPLEDSEEHSDVPIYNFLEINSAVLKLVGTRIELERMLRSFSAVQTRVNDTVSWKSKSTVSERLS